jgi:hypothetical protein
MTTFVAAGLPGRRISRPFSSVPAYLICIGAIAAVQAALGAAGYFYLDDIDMTAPRRNANADLVTGRHSAVVVPTPDAAFDRAVITSADPSADICLSATAGYVAAYLR